MTLGTLTLLFNGFTLSLVLGFLIIILWYDSRRPINQVFAVFLSFVLIWNIGSFLSQFNTLSVDLASVNLLAIAMLELGFTGSSIALYLLSVHLVGIQRTRIRLLAFSSLGLIALFRVFLLVAQVDTIADAEADILEFEFDAIFAVIYLIFDGLSVFVLWRYRRKLRSRLYLVGVLIFTMSQAVVLVTPTLSAISFSSVVSGIGVLLISFALIRQEVIVPLTTINAQIETIHDIGVSIANLVSIDTVLNNITHNSARWLRADGVCLLLRADDDPKMLQVMNIYALPEAYLQVRTTFGDGLSGAVVEREKTIFLENFARDWHGNSEFPMADETFGSVIATPLRYANEIIGVLVAIAGRTGPLFDDEDVYLLELIGSQVATAISYSQAFQKQKELTAQVEASRGRLQAVLSGTDNLVIAFDRYFRVSFINPAGQDVFKIDEADAVFERLPRHIFPERLVEAYRKIKQQGKYVYELNFDDKIYLAFVTLLTDENKRINGWVVVLNDVTELKELDRLKSEMVRMASHDLKNPLMGAMTHLDLLRDEINGDEQSELVQSIDVVETQLERMNRIIRGILDVERITTVKSLTDRCSPVSVVESAINELTHFISDRGVEVVTEFDADLPEFWGNCKQFERAIVNLIENAVKFSIDQKSVFVSVKMQNSMIVFEIQDYGVGIPEERRHRIFDRFYRANQPGVEHITGSGLGLSIVKTIVENHNGIVDVTSEVGEGSTFIIRVPSTSRVFV
jgi:signal transduction histidine kinase